MNKDPNSIDLNDPDELATADREQPEETMVGDQESSPQEPITSPPSEEDVKSDQANPEPAEEKKGRWKFFAIPLALLLVIYLGASLYFDQHALPHTTVNGKDVSFQAISSIDPLNDVVREDIAITKKDGTVAHLKPGDIDMTLSLEQPLVIDQNGFSWPLSFFSTDEYEAVIQNHYDEAKLNAFIVSNFMENSTEPVNAKIDVVDGVYSIVPEVEGNSVDQAVATEQVLKTINDGSAELDLAPFYKTPEIRQDDAKLNEALKEINAFTDKTLDIDFIYQKEHMDKALLSTFVEVGEDLEVQFNKEKLREFVVSLAYKYDTYDIPRTFESTNRGTIQVPPGIYGFALNVDSTQELIENALETGLTEIDPAYDRMGTLRTEDGGDIGSTYIEVDLTNQHMWYYENGQLIVSTPVVTGDPTRGVATPPGTNVVWHKERNKPLEGIDPDGNPYVAPVDYWLAVDWSHTGIHNARWRENAGGFGGSIFRGNGSYGCINTPYSDVQTIYENVYVGTPVLMYE